MINQTCTSGVHRQCLRTSAVIAEVVSVLSDISRPCDRQVVFGLVDSGVRFRLQNQAFDKQIYKRRNAVERCFNRLKQWRGIATRYEKTAQNYQAAVTLASLLMWA